MKTGSSLLDAKARDLVTELTVVEPSLPISKIVSRLREKNAYEVFIIDDSKIGMVNIRDILRAKNIHSRKAHSLAIQVPRVDEETDVSEIASLMTNYRLRAVPVVDGEAVGEVTALSICKALCSAKSLELPIGKIMTGHPMTLKLKDSLGKAKSLINRRNVDHLPVVEDGKTFGVLTSQRILDTLVPAERISIESMVSEKQTTPQLSVEGLMDSNPIRCRSDEDACSVLGKMIERGKTCVLAVFGEELQGIATYRDFIKTLVRPGEEQIPVYLVGLPTDPFEAETAKTKFNRVVSLLRKSYPDILEARCTVKTSTPRKKKGRKRYEAKAIIYTPRKMYTYSEAGWDLASVFDVLSDRLKRLMSGRVKHKIVGRKAKKTVGRIKRIGRKT